MAMRINSQSFHPFPQLNMHIMYSLKKLVFFGVFNLFLVTTVTAGAIKIPANVSVPAVIVFGDSIVDPGNNNNLKTITKCNFPPYGRDFPGSIPTGRFSNGLVPSDILAGQLGVKTLVPAYLDPNVKPGDLLTGVNFASGGAGWDPLTSTLASAISLDAQLSLFKDYISKLNSLVGEQKAQSILKNAVYLVVSSSNDIANNYFGNRARMLQYDVDGYTAFINDKGTTFLKEIYALGARRVGVYSAPPLGCIPSQRTVAGGLLRSCSSKLNDASKLYNSKLVSSLASLTNSLPNSRFVYLDIYNPLLDIIQNYKKFGFEVENLGCCGSGLIEVIVLCNQYAPHTCPDASKYVFWDSYHPTERAYDIIGNKFLTEAFSRLF